jgi:hypothetical protein
LTHLRPAGPLDCSDGQVLHEWCLAGLGLAWRSTWEVEQDLAAGRLQVVLDDYAAPPNGIFAVFPQRKHLPLRVRLWIDFIKHSYGDPRVVGQRDVLDLPAQEVHIAQAALALVVQRQREHCIGHVQAVGHPGGAHAAG